MSRMNHHYGDLPDSYFFTQLGERTRAFMKAHPGESILRLGVGDVTQPLCPAVIEALHRAVEEQAHGETFHGYVAENGSRFYREAVRGYYLLRGIELDAGEIFASCGAGDELGDVLDLFGPENTALVPEPAYPAYVDTNLMAGHKVIRLPAGPECGFAPWPDPSVQADILYLCSPNNPTGAVYTREKLQAWVDYANARQAVLIFDAAYEAFVGDPALPRSIYEIPGSRTCAIEISSLSKTAGFTGTRCGYTVVPKALGREGMSLHAMWVRNRATKTNGVSYILQKGAAATFTPEGIAQTRAAIAVYKQNARVLMEALDRCGLWYCGGENAPYIFLRCPQGMDSWTFFEYLLEHARIAATPGVGFGPCGEGYMRLSCFTRPEEARAAARRLEALLKP